MVDNPSFKMMMNEVVDYGSCCECGSCVLVCPHNVIDYIEGKPKQIAKKTAAFDFCGISEGIGCDVCAQVCPRLHPREFQLADLLWADDLPPHAGVFGRYRQIVAARCKDPEILARCQDGGVVTGILAWGLRTGYLDGAVVSMVEPENPCAPVPKAVATVDEVIAGAGSWYTYVPNNLALQQAEEKGLTNVGFVGVPCQVTPIRKMQLKDAGYLVNGRKKEKHIERQTKFLKGFGDRVKLSIGLLCTEVFTFQGLMVDKIEREMGIPLTDVRQFNVKGKVLIYKKSGELVEMSLRKAQEYARPECHHCGDFSGEVADISCGGVGSTNWTIVVVRSRRGQEVFDALVRDGLLDVKPMEEFESSMRILMRLAKKQHLRVPVPPGRDPSFVRPPEFLAGT
ncbi:MAG: coenzyme hydrogenase subunit beta [Candidatus Binatota bacterium]|nr:coenzyme hydrogenase subunit beta [Candidatus Binatota bacterium]